MTFFYCREDGRVVMQLTVNQWALPNRGSIPFLLTGTKFYPPVVAIVVATVVAMTITMFINTDGRHHHKIIKGWGLIYVMVELFVLFILNVHQEYNESHLLCCGPSGHKTSTT